MPDFFKDAKFITTEFENYFAARHSYWGNAKSKLYQHTDLVSWNGLPMFVKDFEIDSTDNTKLYFTSLGCIDIFINGERLEGAEMKPGWSSYDKRTMYMGKSISGMLKVGKNRILAVASSGWYTGRIAGNRYGDNPPAVMLSVICNGKTIAATDESWLCKVGGQIRTADIWDGEYRDNREDSYAAISSADYKLDEWKEPEIFNYEGEVTPYIGSEIKVRDALALKPQTITVFDGINYNGTHYGRINVVDGNAKLPVLMKIGQKLIVDLGQETVGWLKIKVKAKKGTEIKIRYSEFLNDSGDMNRGNDGPEGSVYTINLRSALAKAYYVTGSDEVEEYRPTFTFFGYRYVELSADNAVEFIDMTAEIVGNDNIETGKIETSNPLVNKLFSNALWGQRSNYVSVPTDCPQRDERLGWTGDAQAFSGTAAYNADVYGFFRKWMQDMRDSQSESGGYADVNPRVGCCSSEDACAWGDAGVIIPYNLYKIYGDDTMIKEHFDSMDKYLTGLVEKYGYSGAQPRYGDWLAYDWCDNKFISSAYFVRDIDMMLEMCTVAGREDKIDYYKDMRAKAYDFYCENFMENGVPTEKTQCNKIIALAFGLIDADKEQLLANELAEQIKENGDRLSCGFLGTYNLCPTLSKFGKDKTAYNLLLQRNEPSWLYSIDQGATTIWERWNSYTKEKGFGDVGMNSFNHYAYGAIVEWMYRYMAGIEAVEPGFKKFNLYPRIDMRTADELPEGQENIKWVKAEFNSVNGLIKSEWNTENGLTYKCTVPEGTSATLTLPAVSDKVTINGKEMDMRAGSSAIIMTLEGGDYTIVQ